MTHQESDGNGESGTQNDSARMKMGLRRGIRAFFDVDDITISFWGSAWTFLEVVRIDDHVVSRKRSLRFLTRHHFEHAGVHYEVVFRLKSKVRGQMEIELFRDGELIDSDRAPHNKPGIDPKTGRFSVWRAALQIAPFFIGGMAFGAGAAILVDYLTGG